MARFSGKVALVTGAGSGLGRSVAEEFAAEGAQVVLADRHRASNEATAQRIAAAGGTALAVEADVSERGSVKALVQAAVSRFGKLDIAVNNAGVDQTPTPFLDLEEAVFDRVLGVNLRGMLLCMQEEIRVMLPAARGAIVNVTSVTDMAGSPMMAAYVASKHGALGLTRSAAIEFASSGIRINAVSPGAMLTPMLEGVTALVPDFVERGNAMHPIGRIADPREAARVILFLASDDASYVIGHSLKVDGGYTVV